MSVLAVIFLLVDFGSAGSIMHTWINSHPVCRISINILTVGTSPDSIEDQGPTKLASHHFSLLNLA